jgi:hypothetical protein
MLLHPSTYNLYDARNYFAERTLSMSRATKIFAGLSFLTVLGILVCTLWPFDFLPPNRVFWLGQSNGLRLAGRGVLLTESPLVPSDFQPADGRCSLEVWIKPARVNSVFTILDVFRPDNHTRFRLQQYDNGLIVSHNVTAPSGVPVRIKVDVNDALERGKATLVTLTFGKTNTAVFLDGKHVQTFPGFHVSLRDFAGRLAIGNSAFHLETWPGEIYGVALYSRELSADEVLSSFQNWTSGGSISGDPAEAIGKYTFAERAGDIVHNQSSHGVDLIIPKRFRVPEHSYMTLPWREFDASWSYFWDVVRNVVGFMPLGFFLCAWLFLRGQNRHPILSAILVGAALSFSVELLQAYIPQRESGITDIITNTSGTALGALLVSSQPMRSLLTRRRSSAASGNC